MAHLLLIDDFTFQWLRPLTYKVKIAQAYFYYPLMLNGESCLTNTKKACLRGEPNILLPCLHFTQFEPYTE
ncbi:hypothetical protein BBM16_13385 [Vibrio parahaemolyticus]|nr:hypothetical protein BBM16_13385 [Vibrio parahaemolyticus]